MIKITEDMILGWLNFDGFRYEVTNIQSGSGNIRKVKAINDTPINEFRLTSLVDFLNKEIARQIDDNVVANPTSTSTLGINVSERIRLAEAIGGAPPPSKVPMEFNAVGLFKIDPHTGEVISGRCSFFNPDKTSVALDKGKKVMVEVR